MSALPGLSVGHATDTAAKTGVTVFLPDEPAVAAVHVAGGAPASRETDLLHPGNTIERVDAIVLSGGSAFGLAAADGVTQWLAARGRGFAVGDIRVPIVPAASLFDLANGGDKSLIAPAHGQSIYPALAIAACEAAGGTPAVGSVGAGTGATTADLKGGFGMAETVLEDGARVVAFVAVNAVGRVTLGATPHFRAAPFEMDGEFGGVGLPASLPPDAAAVVTKRSVAPQASTTLAVVATDCALTRAEAKRLAIAAHDGIALAIFPAHTPFDGDTVFALSTGARDLSGGPRGLLTLSAAAAATLARAHRTRSLCGDTGSGRPRADLAGALRSLVGYRLPGSLPPSPIDEPCVAMLRPARHETPTPHRRLRPCLRFQPPRRGDRNGRRGGR